MKIIVATAAIAAATAILAAAPSLAHVDSSPGGGATANQTANGAEQSQMDHVATHFSGQGAWVVVNTLGGKDAVDAAERAGVVFTIMGLGGVAILVRIRLRAETLARNAKRQPYS
jgi:hypothetical protein